MSTNTALDQIKARVEGHTEGPWELHLGAHWFITSGATDVVHMVDDSKESEANAELFLEAPKLLAALEAVEALAKGAPRMVTFTGAIVSGSVLADEIIEAITEALR